MLSVATYKDVPRGFTGRIHIEDIGEVWHLNGGILHNVDGPAIVLRDSSNVSFEYFIDGIKYACKSDWRRPALKYQLLWKVLNG